MLASGEFEVIFIRYRFKFEVAACFDAVDFAAADWPLVEARSKTTVVGATAGFVSSIVVMSREVVRLVGVGTGFDPREHAVDPFEAAKTIGSVESLGIESAITRSE